MKNILIDLPEAVEAISNLVKEEVREAEGKGYARGWYNAWIAIENHANENLKGVR